MTEMRENIRKHVRIIAILSAGIQIGMFFVISASFASDNSSGLGPHFGAIPVFSEEQISELRTFLKTVDDSDCRKLGKECPSLNEFFNKLLTDIRNPNNPKLVIYIDENLKIRTI